MTPQNLYSVTLRPLQDTDIDFVYSLTSNPAVAQYMRFSTHTSRAEAEALYREYSLPRHYGYVIRRLDNDAPIGVAALKPEEAEETCDAGSTLKNRDSIYTVSVFTHPSCWNHGYSTQVSRLLQAAAASLGITALKAYVVEENTGSRRVLEKTDYSLQEILHFPDLPSGLYIYTWTPPSDRACSRH